MKILLLEDDIPLNTAITKVLQLESHSVDSFHDGEKAYEVITNPYDLYILDINVPNIDGLEILRRVKENNTASKVIMISSDIDINTLAKAYGYECDDYLKKPFNIQEIRLKLRRLSRELKKSIDLHEEVEYDLEGRSVLIEDRPCSLTKKEKDLLHLLVVNRGRTVSYSQIQESVYPDDVPTHSAIRSLVKRLRQKIGRDIIANAIEEGYWIK
jgi:DNA-binding response OmpR family regulator